MDNPVVVPHEPSQPASPPHESAGEMLPCPFCNCPFVGVSVPAHPRVRMSVKCPSCHSHGGYGNTEAEAIAAWNTRTPDLQAENARLRGELKWYGEQARLSRLIHSEGDAGRNALSADGGERARLALSNNGEG